MEVSNFDDHPDPLLDGDEDDASIFHSSDDDSKGGGGATKGSGAIDNDFDPRAGDKKIRGGNDLLSDL